MKLGILLIFSCVGSSFAFFTESDKVPASAYNYPSNPDLDIKKLLKQALENADGHIKASKLYKANYGDALVSIDNSSDYVYNVDIIHLNHNQAENFLATFGASVERLKILFKDIPKNKHENIIKLVSDYCSGTLIEFNLKSYNNGAFDKVQKPFNNVERVYFDGVWTETRVDSWTFNELFPSLRFLSLSYPGGDIYNRHCNFLTELRIIGRTSDDLNKFIRKNSQIQQLRIQVTTMEVLKTISETLHDLKSFEFYMPMVLESKVSFIQFESIERVTIRDIEYNINSMQITFKRVERLKLHLSGDVDDDDSGVDAKSICKFLDSNKQVETLQLNYPSSQLFFKQLREKLDKEWTIIFVNEDYSTVEIAKGNQSQVLADFQMTTDEVINQIATISTRSVDSTSNIESNTQSVTENNFDENSTISNTTSKTTEVNNQPLNLEDLDLIGLVNVALESEDGRQRANEVYKKKFDRHLVEIHPFIAQYSVIDGFIYFSHDLAEHFLKAFGSSIKSLLISYHYIPNDKRKMCGKLISEYCSETLIEFNIISCKNGDFDDIQKPFKKVESVDFSGDWSELNEDSWGFNKLFPELRILNLTSSSDFIYNHHYPHLIELNVFSSAFNKFTKLVANNPQIRKLRLQETSMEVLQTISNKLIYLEVLAFNLPCNLNIYNGSEIQFNTVNTVSIKDLCRELYSVQIKFKQLKRFGLHASGVLNDEWIEFIGANKDLETLIITAGNCNNATFFKLAEKVNSLIEARINCEPDSTDGVKKFLDSNKQMKKVTLYCRRYSDVLFKQLNEILGNEWTTIAENKDYSILNIIKMEQSVGLKDDNQSITENNVGNSIIANTAITEQSHVSDSTSTENTQYATENTNQNSTIGNTTSANTTNPDNGASSIRPSTLLTISIFAIIINVFNLWQTTSNFVI